MVGNSAATILQQLQQKTRPMSFAPGTYNFDLGTVATGVSADITGGFPRGMTNIASGLELQVTSTRRQTIRNMRFTRNDGDGDGRTLSIGPHVGLDIINCEIAGGASADDFSIYGWPCRVRISGSIIGATSSLGHGFLAGPNTPTAPPPIGAVSFCAYDCEFRTAGVRNPQVTDAVCELVHCKVWKSQTTAVAASGAILWVVNTKFYSTKHPLAVSQVFQWPGLIHIQLDWATIIGGFLSQRQPQVYLKNCTLDGVPATRKDLCVGFKQDDFSFHACPDDTYFLPGSD